MTGIIADKWYWCQDGRNLNAIVLAGAQLGKAIPDDGPFDTQKEAMAAALKEYKDTVSMYRKAIARLEADLAKLP